MYHLKKTDDYLLKEYVMYPKFVKFHLYRLWQIVFVWVSNLEQYQDIEYIFETIQQIYAYNLYERFF